MYNAAAFWGKFEEMARVVFYETAFYYEEQT